MSRTACNIDRSHVEIECHLLLFAGRLHHVLLGEALELFCLCCQPCHVLLEVGDAFLVFCYGVATPSQIKGGKHDASPPVTVSRYYLCHLRHSTIDVEGYALRHKSHTNCRYVVHKEMLSCGYVTVEEKSKPVARPQNIISLFRVDTYLASEERRENAQGTLYLIH